MIPVYFERFEVGRIEVGGNEFSFDYHPRWLDTHAAFPVSLSMLMREGPFGHERVLPWLMNLLPEEQALTTVGRNLGVSPQDTIGLLERIGRDVAGALSIGEPRPGENPGYRRIEDEQALEKIIQNLSAKPFLAGEEGVSMSLAGVQEKLPVAMGDGKMSIPVNGAVSTHILKPDSDRLFGSVQNEALCLILATRCELDTTQVTTGMAGERAYLLVERYDRKEVGDRTIRVHQEDFCQAMTKPPAAKYESNQSGIRGPTLEDFFGLIDRYMTAVDTNKFLNAVIFNILICNTDSHAKNYSILLSGGKPRLAPLYDLMCGAAWDGITLNHSQKIGGKNRGNHIHGRHWKRMAAACGLSETMVVQRVKELAETVLAEVGNAVEEVSRMPAGDHPMLPRFQEAIEARCRTVLGNLAD